VARALGQPRRRVVKVHAAAQLGAHAKRRGSGGH
jgi:hypothetical protein